MKNVLAYHILLAFVLILSTFGGLMAQVLPVGTPLLEDYYRRKQLLGEIDTALSFSIRPLSNEVLKQVDVYNPEKGAFEGKSIFYIKNGRGTLQIMPITWQNQYTSTYPYGWNDGAMIPARGFQTYVSAGVFAKYKFLSIQIRPEFVYAQNKAYDGFKSNERQLWSWYYLYANEIDLPERFGNKSYTRFFPGQSSIRLNFNPVSIGISTENLWWGPGIRNSIMMSNTAPGFLHATINTTKPIKTPIGSFEGQIIGGKLEASGFTPKALGNAGEHDEFYRPKPDDWRYLSAFIITYQPKWISGFSVGLSQAFTMYSQDMSGFGDYIPLFQSATKSKFQNADGNSNSVDEVGQDQQVSVFARWVVPSAQFEIYGEYGRTDHPWNVRDLFVMPNHSRAYLFGLKKILPLTIKGGMVEANLEITQLGAGRAADLRSTGPFYTHSVVRDGYTNRGQLLGAGVGLGSNIQSVNVSWFNGLKNLGVELERIVHNSDFFYLHTDDYRKKWTDIGLSAFAGWDYKNFILTGKMNLTKAYNYQYQLEERPELQNFWKFKSNDRVNLQLQVGMQYRF